ncbi:MAG: flagellar motor protein MotA [Rhodospirillaceae bacterium]|jgi:hypothetical protein|nr:flagellar motor protein MotA [Rhodospirillales bacterium]MBT3907791.1 flagellar motor protein MotA [Rhodospirillaceae bacterium]MBT4703113.1 flagellar motor protein MotA [Rhodospirillaceae bacterium]MBT5033375.1 flagellar motor protein MotA [Rhodospirillaceae bacterium]MBT6219219.1 flagellar motor protein MotA [Rhodospirillaceae bacterium]
MSRPRRYLFRMILFLATVLGVCGMLFQPLRDAFLSNGPLNGLILGVLILGIIYNFRQVLMLGPEVAWIEGFRQTDRTVLSQKVEPRLLAPMATMMGEHSDRISLSTLSMRSLLDGIYSRLDESKDISRYTIGLLIFLGLLGTFWGLLGTVSSIGNVISSLSVADGDASKVFGALKSGLQAPLDGMGTAFSSSLFGLAGSLVLGFLDLQAGQAQNRFYNDLEEWLSSLTRLSTGALSGDGDHSVPAYVQALLEQTAESLDNLQRTLTRGEESRTLSNVQLVELSEKLGTLTDHMRTEQALMKSLAESQVEMRSVFTKFGEGDSVGGLDEASRIHIRNLDLYLARLLEEMHSGREELNQLVRREVRLLARTIAAKSEDPDS